MASYQYGQLIFEGGELNLLRMTAAAAAVEFSLILILNQFFVLTKNTSLLHAQPMNLRVSLGL